MDGSRVSGSGERRGGSVIGTEDAGHTDALRRSFDASPHASHVRAVDPSGGSLASPPLSAQAKQTPWERLGSIWRKKLSASGGGTSSMPAARRGVGRAGGGDGVNDAHLEVSNSRQARVEDD